MKGSSVKGRSTVEILTQPFGGIYFGILYFLVHSGTWDFQLYDTARELDT